MRARTTLRCAHCGDGPSGARGLVIWRLDRTMPPYTVHAGCEAAYQAERARLARVKAAMARVEARR